MRRACLLAILLIGGCTEPVPSQVADPPLEDGHPDEERPDDEKQNDEEPPPPIGPIGPAGITRSDCMPPEGAPAFRLLEAHASRDPLLGACGELAWIDPVSEALRFTPIDGEATEVDTAGHPIWLGRDRVLYVRDDSQVILAGGEEEPRTWTAPLSWKGGAIPGTDAFWTCASQHGLYRLDASGVTQLTPDFFDTEYLQGCLSIDVGASGAIAYATSDRRVGVVDPASGASTILEMPFHPLGSEDDEGLSREDLVLLTPDGSRVLHAKRWRGTIGWDAVGTIAEGEVTVATVDDSAEPLRLPGMLDDAWLYGGVARSWEWYGPWMATAPGVLLPEEAGVANLLLPGETRRLEIRPLASRGNHVFVATAEGGALLELTDGNLQQLVPTTRIEHALPYRWGGPVAFSHGAGTCIAWPEVPEQCHTPLDAVTVWSEEAGPRRIAFGTVPLLVLAVGPRGEVIVEGRLLDGAPPPTAERRDLEWRLLLFDEHGQLVRELERADGISGAMGGEHFAVLQRDRRLEDGWSYELVRVDWKSGEERVLIAGEHIEGWALDDSDRRLTALVQPLDESLPLQLWHGVVE